MTRARTNSSSRTEQEVVEATRRPRRGLVIDNFSRAPATGVWYYRVDVSAYEEELLPTFVDENEGFSDDDRSSDAESVPDRTDVEYYSILRRYNDFLHLYEQIRVVVVASEGDTSSLPPFPSKEYISRALVGLLWRVPSSKSVLEDRRTKFEALLRWIENHPTARNCPAFVKFLGKPPQTKDGYVSLKEYTSPDWLSSLQQVTQGVEERKRRYSADSSTIRSLLERSNSETSGILGTSRRQRLLAVKEMPSTRVLGKRRNRSDHRNRRHEPPCKKVTLSAAEKLPNADQVPPAPLSCGKRKVAHVEGNNTRKKQCVAWFC